MRKTVERILASQFDYEKGALDISTSRIELALRPGEVFTGSFSLRVPSGREAEGHVYSNDIRMKLITDTFQGEEAEIGYTFSAQGLEEGDVIQGEIYIISNQGEYYLPYVSTIQQNCIDSSLGNIKNLFHFANLAKANWEEAVKLYYSPNFINIFTGNDNKYKKIYLGLSRFYSNEQNVEEFLVSISKKQPVEYILERDTINISDPSSIVEESVNITRNGWGYTLLNVDVQGSFISVSKNQVTDNDFLGNYLSFPVLINPDNLHGGVNFGKIRFYNAFTSFEVNVTVSVEIISKAEMSRTLEYSHARYDVITYYEAFRTKKITRDTWLAQTGIIVDRMMTLQDKALLPRLFKAQLLITEERFNEAKWILDQAENEFQANQDFSSTLWAYYLYLTTLYNRDESYIDDITDEVTRIYDTDPSDWRVGWMLLYLSEDFAVSPSKKWLFIEQQIETGCTSPVFYVEAINMLIANPGLLTKLTSFEIRVLRYACENELLNTDIINQFVYLVSKEKIYTDKVFNILEKCYEITPSSEIVTAVCEYLIKGNRVDSKAHDWYLEAVNRELRVTKLFEFFMESVNLSEDTVIPKMVYLYFTYDSDLSWEYAAYLYARVINNRDEMPDIFDSYKEQMEKFAVSSLLEGLINKDMAVVYRYIFADSSLTDEMAKNLSRILFTHKISCENRNLTKVVVYQSRECVETVYPIENGVAYIPLYNKDFEILFEDGFTNRFHSSVDYDLEMLMVPGKLASKILSRIHDNLEFDVYACECSTEMVEITEETKDRYTNILNAPEIDEEYKTEVRSKLMQYYYDNDAIRELDGILEELLPQNLSQRERVRAIRFMVIRGMYDKAVDWIIRFGTEGVEPRDLVKLCSKLIERNEYAYSDDLIRIASSVFFRGKYDEIILKYMVDNYRGMTKDMRKVFKAAENFDVDIYTMCENMILQMLTTGYFVSERMAIYSKYVQGGANTEIQSAFLAQCSFDYFVKEQIMEPLVFEELTKAKLRGENIQTVCKLAYLKYYSENQSELDDNKLHIIGEYLEELIGEGIYMSFFKEFMENTTSKINKFSDKTIIEYKTDPGKRVFIHYIIEGDEETLGEYVTEEMPDMYGGVHAKAFILFFGENLLYYITEEADGEELLTESASIQKSDISRDIYNSRFNEVNDIVIAKTLQDYDTVNKLLYDYYKQAYIVRKMFTLE